MPLHIIMAFKTGLRAVAPQAAGVELQTIIEGERKEANGRGANVSEGPATNRCGNGTCIGNVSGNFHKLIMHNVFMNFTDYS